MPDQETVTPPAERPPERIPQSILNMHTKALSAIERNPDIAIKMLLGCTAQSPGFIDARRDLHKACIGRYLKKHGGKVSTSPLAGMLAGMKKSKVQALIKKGQVDAALQMCEEFLAEDPLNIHLVKLFAETAVAANRGEAGLMGMEIAKEHIRTDDINSLETLGKLYFQTKQYKKARECFEKVFRVKPTDSDIAKLLKDSEALATLNSGWEEAHKAGDYRVGLKNKKEAEKLEAAAKSVKSKTDSETLIRETIEKINREPKNVNYYLALVGLYLQQKRYAEGLDAISKAREVIGQDPELDRRYADVKQSMLRAEIDELNAAGQVDEAAQKEGELNQYIFDDIAERVGRYPNDYHLRFLLGEQYAKYGYPDEAIQQLQLALKSPKDRVTALYTMAECFRSKGMLDMAVEQLKQALEALPTMDATKMNVYYLLGEICEEEGQLDAASQYFKEIYRADVTYKDISERVQRIYAAQKSAGN